MRRNRDSPNGEFRSVTSLSTKAKSSVEVTIGERKNGSAVLHGEIYALENAGRQSAKIKKEFVMDTTLSPCPMGSGAFLLRGITQFVISEDQTLIADADSWCSRGVELEIVKSLDRIALMTNFIADTLDF